MPKGSIYKPEAQITNDAKTGAKIRQVTNHDSIHHHPFFFIPAYDNGMNWLIFVSHRTGEPQIFGEELASGKIVQLTDKPGLGEWSVYPARAGDFVLFTRGHSAWRIELDGFAETELVFFGDDMGQEGGMVGPAMGTTALSRENRLWAVPVKAKDRFCMHLIDLGSGSHEVVLEDEKIGHPQFCPDDNNLILYLATMTDPIWLLDIAAKKSRRVYQRDAGKKQWITHASWIPGCREVSLVDWPHGIIGVGVDTGAVRKIADFNAWHAVSSPDGYLMVADTHFPDIGLQLLDSLDGAGEPEALCYPEATQVGEHWGKPFPYDKGPIKVYAPQHTHPHPSFAPDMSRVVFTSDRTGYPQVYECYL